MSSTCLEYLCKTDAGFLKNSVWLNRDIKAQKAVVIALATRSKLKHRLSLMAFEATSDAQLIDRAKSTSR